MHVAFGRNYEVSVYNEKAYILEPHSAGRGTDIQISIIISSEAHGLKVQ